ncbi:MAG: helix-turn-helix transcriptional regulator [Clostridiales bacterium]|nr:helix-turn-helix transcriptional regulator [Clostridiales bacterium]
MQFNEKLKQLRAQKGIPQAELAKKIFVSRSAVAKWESGLGLPSEDSLNQLAEFFGVEPSELLSDPDVETVIVAKNSKISKQKIWIISLLVLAAIAVAVLITLCVCFINNPAKPIITRQLIFETEKGIDTGKIINYPDSEISADVDFADTRTFEIKYGVGIIRLPKLFVKTTVNGDASYERVEYSNVVFSCSDNIVIRCEQDEDNIDYVAVIPHEYYDIEFNDWANIKYGEFLISIRVFRNHIAVESVTVGFSDKSSEIGLAQREALSCNIKPYDASYTHYEYTIENIVKPNGEEYSGDLSEYAYIDKYYLTTTKNIEIGSVIYISATTYYDNVKSNVFAATVVRVGIERITASFQGYSTSYIYVGESLPLAFNVYPDNASFNVLEEHAKITLLRPNWQRLKRPTTDGF